MITSRKRYYRIGSYAVLGAAALIAGLVVSRRSRNKHAKNQHRFYRRWVLYQAYCQTLESWRRWSSISNSVLREVGDYLQGTSSSEEYPPTLERALNLACAPQSVDAFRTVKNSLGDSTSPSFLDSLLQAILSDRGQRLVEGSTTRAVHSLVCALHSTGALKGDSKQSVEPFLEWMGTPKGETFACKIVTSCVSTGVATFVEKTKGSNPFDEMMETVSKPQHLRAAKSLVATVTTAGVNAIANNLRKSWPPDPPLQPAALQKNGFSNPKSNQLDLTAVGGRSHRSSAQSSQGVAYEVMRVCASQPVRETCAAVVKAGCSGAVDAACTHLRELEIPQVKLSPWIGIFQTILLAWLLFLPLWVLHTSVMPQS